MLSSVKCVFDDLLLPPFSPNFCLCAQMVASANLRDSQRADIRANTLMQKKLMQKIRPHSTKAYRKEMPHKRSIS